MNTIAEKLAAAEQYVNEILGQWTPLTGRLDDLDKQLSGVGETLVRLGEESRTLRTEVESARQGLDRVLAILAETKEEGAQLTAKQEENEQLCKTLTGMFGEAFQVVSRFLDTAQKIGIVDQNKTKEILEQSPLPVPEPATEEPVVEEAVEPAVEEPVVEEAVEPAVEEPIVGEAVEPVVEEPIVEEVVEPVVEEPIVEEVVEPVVEKPVVEEVVEPAAEEPVVEELAGIFERSLPEIPSEIEGDLAMPSLPDVTSAPDELPPVDDAEMEAESKSPEEMATQLDLPPLQLGAASDTLDDVLSAEEEQRIEDLLTDLAKPISTDGMPE